jgi:hypothetical protein
MPEFLERKNTTRRTSMPPLGSHLSRTLLVLVPAVAILEHGQNCLQELLGRPTYRPLQRGPYAMDIDAVTVGERFRLRELGGNKT